MRRRKLINVDKQLPTIILEGDMNYDYIDNIMKVMNVNKANVLVKWMMDYGVSVEECTHTHLLYEKHKCQFCGSAKDVTYSCCPYSLEIHETITDIGFWCSECDYEMALNI